MSELFCSQEINGETLSVISAKALTIKCFGRDKADGYLFSESQDWKKPSFLRNFLGF